GLFALIGTQITVIPFGIGIGILPACLPRPLSFRLRGGIAVGHQILLRAGRDFGWSRLPNPR
ncbi:MAG: hypothetical protein ABI645_07420, partial [Pseudomonadota bacterium]